MTLRNWTALFLLGLLWGSSYLWIKIGVQEIGPFTLVALRLLIGAAALGAVLVARRQALPMTRAILAPLAVMGVTNTALPFILISWGELTVDSAVASVLTGAAPLFVLILSHFFLDDERITLPRLAGLLLGFAGVVILAGRSSSPVAPAAAAGGLDLGVLAIVAAVMSYAVSAVFARRTLRGVPHLVAAFVPLVIADSVSWIGAATLEAPIEIPQAPLTWLAVVWLGLFGSCAAYLVYFYLIQNVGATRTAQVAYLIALVGVALGVVFLDERLDWRLAAGAVLVLGGITVVSRFPAGRSKGRQLPASGSPASTIS
ncbi:MAG TPA: DMT family transporter, partial [Anaerolineales bacterium]